MKLIVWSPLASPLPHLHLLHPTPSHQPINQVHPVYVKGFLANYLTILNDPTSPNTDGIDPDSTQDVLITNCYIHTGRLRRLRATLHPDALRFKPNSSPDSLLSRLTSIYFRFRAPTGDDSIAIKSGWDQYGYDYGVPSRNITIHNCTFSSPCCAGVCIGSCRIGLVPACTL
jgi:polygalacturonase